MHRVDARVVRSVERWRHRFEGGGVRVRGRRLPALAPGERWAVRAGSVGVSRRDPNQPVTSWDRRPGAAGLLPRRHGVAYATDRRVLVADAGEVLGEWWFDDLDSVQVTGDWRGVLLVPDPRPELVDVLTTEWNRWVIGAAPDLRLVATAWLEVEATFAWSRGRLDSWMSRLPDRLSLARAG